MSLHQSLVCLRKCSHTASDGGETEKDNEDENDRTSARVVQALKRYLQPICSLFATYLQPFC